MAERSKAICNLSTSHRRTGIRIPAGDYDIDRSELEIMAGVEPLTEEGSPPHREARDGG